MFHLIITCTGSKNIAPGQTIKDAVNIVNPPPFTIQDLYTCWGTLLNNQLQTSSNLVTPLQLYKRGLWKAGIDAYNEIQCPKHLKHLWIISCGFGLISMNDYICWYAATFSSHPTDSIYIKKRFSGLNRDTTNKLWWNNLTSNPIIKSGNYRSIHNLVNSVTSKNQIVIAAGKEYLNAIFEDLDQIIVNKSMPQLSIIGYKLENNIYHPDVPKHLKQFTSPFTDSNKYRNFLISNIGKTNNTQKNNRAAQFIIKHYPNTNSLLYNFP